MKKINMKKTIAIIAASFTVIAASAAIVHAEGQTTDTAASATTVTTSTTAAPASTDTTTATTTTTTAATTTPTTDGATATTTATTTTATAPAATTTGSSIVIAPDSVIYPLKLMVESVQTALTFTPEGKAELLVTIANKRLAEADLMTERNKQELVLSVMKAYVKTVNEASEQAEEAAQTQQDIKPILDSIQITQQTADQLVIKVTGTVPPQIADQLKTVVADQVKKTIVNQALAEAKSQERDAGEQVRLAQEQLKAAQQSGNPDLVKQAADALNTALQDKADASSLKDQVNAYKKEVVSSIDQKGQDEEKGNVDKDKEKLAKKEAILQKQLEKKQEILQKQLAKRQEIYNKHLQKNQEQLKKLQEKFGGKNSQDKNQNEDNNEDNNEND